MIDTSEQRGLPKYLLILVQIVKVTGVQISEEYTVYSGGQEKGQEME